MADDTRPRTATRARAEAPPGLGHGTGEDARKSIGRYEVMKTIGKGAMGVVYKARDPLLDRVVAVKTIMSPQQQGRRVRSAFLERFQREAKAAAKMSHPAIVTIFDVGVDEDSGAPFMVLEYLPGESLADRLDRVRLPLARCVTIGLDLASALAFAHRQRIVHRDVKPANVLHAGDNRWKLADFGIARLPDSDLTQVGIFMGTPGYSPPEAIKEGRYTPQADVFAWGAVMYELLSGRIPYEGPDTKTTNGYVVAGGAPPPTLHDPSIPEPIVQVVMTALQSSAAARFKDASEAEVALRRAWDACLTGAIVHPAVLAMEETPHERAAVRFHEVRGAVPIARPRATPMAMAVPVSGASMPADEVTSIDTRIPQKAAALAAQMAQAQAAQAAADERGDDDPTQLNRRALGAAGAGGAGGGGGSPGSPPSPTTMRGVAPAKPARPTMKTARIDPGDAAPRQVATSRGGLRAVLLALVVVLVILGAAAGLYYAGVIKI